MFTVFETATGLPSNGGTLAPRNAAAMHPPTGVPANGGPCTLADVTFPLGANTTRTDADPVGPSAVLQPLARPAAADSAVVAAPLLKSRPPPPVSVAVGAELVVGAVLATAEGVALA